MGVSKVKVTNLTILADTPEDTSLAIMQYYVGWALTMWHHVEQDLTMIYLIATCPKGTPVDGALASFLAIQTTESKATHLVKVLDQVFYQDELTDFRKSAKTTLNRIITLNNTRNKLAHGFARLRDGKAAFLPFYNAASDFRRFSFDQVGPTPSTVLPTTVWDEPTVRLKAESLREGPKLTQALLSALGELCEDEQSALQTARRMTLDRGLPYDPNPPKIAQREG